MTWPIPKFSRNEVNHAGKILATEGSDVDEWFHAIEVLTNWRACHGYPINTFQATLRNKLKHIDTKAIVAQRLKRSPSILSKLKRFNTMQLAQMQDIGGLRAVVSNIARVRRLEKEYRSYQKSRFKHELVKSKDYITAPKADGYRSIHLVFRYQNSLAPKYNGLLIELQLRTQLQHAWATAVETMGTFLGQALKSSQGERKWLRFFETAGAAFSSIEKCPSVPGYEDMPEKDIFESLSKAEASLRVLEKLRGFAIAANAISIDQRSASYHLIILDSGQKTVRVKPFAMNQLERATIEYAEAEARSKNGEPIEVVLVSAGPIESLRRAYPNYFLDTHDFIRRVEKIIHTV